MFGILRTSRGSPAALSRPDVDRIVLCPRPDATGSEDREGPAAGSPRVRPTAGEPSPQLRIFRPEARRSAKAGIGRARRRLAADLTYVAPPAPTTRRD